MADDDEDAAQPAVRRTPLTRSQRHRAVAAGLLPIGLAALVLTPLAALTGAGPGEVVVAALVYGGLLGLAAGFVYVDRMQARQCPRCGDPAPGDGACATCDYDLVRRPRYACSERHSVALEPGLCSCGRRLQQLPPLRGVGRDLALTLKLGAWLAAFFLGMGVLLTVLGR